MRKPSTSRSKPLSEKQLAELHANAEHILEDCRYKLIRSYPFCGSVIMSLDIKPTRDSRITTAATDGSSIYFDIDFLSRLNDDERLFVLAHEVWHVILQHMVRREGRDPELFNIATDMEVNEMLKAEGFCAPEKAVFPSTYGLSISEAAAEKYYEELHMRDSQQSKNSISMGGDGSSSDSNGASSNGDADSNADGNSSSNPKGVRSGNAAGELDGQFDQHIYEGLEPADAEGDQDDKYGKVGHDASFQPKVDPYKVEEVRSAAIAAAQKIEQENGRGCLPACIARLVNELSECKVSWKEVLSQFVLKAESDRVTWSNPNRRYVSRSLYLPSRTGEKLNIAVGIDTSGSTSKFAKDFLSELNGILNSVDMYELTLVECDAAVGKYEKFNNDNPLSFDSFKMTGGGGTVLAPIFEKLRDEQDEPDCIVIFTDGECETFHEDMDPGIPVLWVLTSHSCDSNFKFGQLVHYEDESKTG